MNNNQNVTAPAALLLMLIIGFAAGVLLQPQQPRWVGLLPDGSQYEGQWLDDKFHGNGSLVWPNGSQYSGQFQHGLRHGDGRMQEADGSVVDGHFVDGLAQGYGVYTSIAGDIYRGEFDRNSISGTGEWQFSSGIKYNGEVLNSDFHGVGVVTYPEGDSYSGDFVEGYYHGDGSYTGTDQSVYSGTFVGGELTGKGRFISPDQDSYNGEFVGWLYHGSGVYVSADGESYTGDFVEGYYHGHGELRRNDGYQYSGAFKYGKAEGEGRQQSANGDVYNGHFSYGTRDGQGRVLLAEAVDGVTEYSGRWYRGKLVETEQRQFLDPVAANTEYALYHQGELLQQQLAALKPGEQGQIDMFFIGFAGYGSERVFGREIDFAQGLFKQQFGAEQRTLSLINSKASDNDVSLATSTSLSRSLSAVGEAMNSEDILFLMLTSHGSKDHRLSVRQPGIKLPDISHQQLAKMIEQAQIKYKVIIVSACYSGGFIDSLASENTLVMTSSNSTRPSFGCTDDADFTYFGRAFFQKALVEQGEQTFESAFNRAKKWVNKWEQEQDYQSSKPQIAVGEAVARQLIRWRSQLASQAESVSTQTAMAARTSVDD
jgi:hypothetical protein